jgi:hypothetical protein
MKRFLSRFGALIHFVLSGFDRLRFRGESRVLNNARGVSGYLFQEQIRYIVKVPTTHRYHLSASGQRVVTALLAAHASDVNRLVASA